MSLSKDDVSSATSASRSASFAGRMTGPDSVLPERECDPPFFGVRFWRLGVLDSAAVVLFWRATGNLWFDWAIKMWFDWAIKIQHRLMSSDGSGYYIGPTPAPPGSTGSSFRRRHMSKLIVVVEHARDWESYFPSDNLVTAEQYLAEGPGDAGKAEVINLCRSYRYLGLGYYCSLLAEARGHRVLPTVRTINDLSRKSIYGLDVESLDASLQKGLAGVDADTSTFELYVYFGYTRVFAMAELARQLFDLFPCPILKVAFRKTAHWEVESIRTIGINGLSESQEDEFAEALNAFSRKVWRKPRSKKKYRYDLAVLHDPEEDFPPSTKASLKRFVKAGRKLGIDVDLITKEDFNRIAEYDGLFIRETTALNHHTYRFAKRAEREGMVVIDDPSSILRCTNKVYLFERLTAHRIPVPRTRVLYRDHPEQLEKVAREFGFPIVLKVPDGSFSRGVMKAADVDELRAAAETLFKQSVLILAQEFFYTEYDWRIGVLNKKPLFVCQYHMAAGHWQIYNHDSRKDSYGDSTTLAVEDAPKQVVDVAVRAANLIGDGLYGVDLKQRGNEVVVIEVNDNPNIDDEVEDAVLGKELYLEIMREFLRRMVQRRG